MPDTHPDHAPTAPGTPGAVTGASEILPGTGRGTACAAGGGGGYPDGATSRVADSPLRQPCGLPPPRAGEGLPCSDPVFTPALKLRFLDELAKHGNVRVAAARCGVSRSGVYLARSRDAAFAQGWQAALVLGREQAAGELAERALEGWQEPVFYRGRQVGTRRRFDVRLLLAHLARLDKACAGMAGGGEVQAARYDTLRDAIVSSGADRGAGPAKADQWSVDRCSGDKSGGAGNFSPWTLSNVSTAPSTLPADRRTVAAERSAGDG